MHGRVGIGRKGGGHNSILSLPVFLANCSWKIRFELFERQRFRKVLEFRTSLLEIGRESLNERRVLEEIVIAAYIRAQLASRASESVELNDFTLSPRQLTSQAGF
jgi:hypothetical protein